MSYESSYVSDWFAQTLLYDSRLMVYLKGRVYDSVPDDGAIYPWVTYAPVTVRDVNGVGKGNRIMVNGLWDVRLVGPQAMGRDVLRFLADRIDKLLQGASAAFPWGYILACIRESVQDVPFTAQGQHLTQVTQTYRVNAQVTIPAA